MDMPKKYHVKQDLFKSIDQPWKAYFLGWMLSDGNVEANLKRMSINVAESDRAILDYFVTRIYEGPRPLYTVKGRPFKDIAGSGKTYHSQPQISLYVCSNALCQDMVEHGLVPKKSLVLQFPSEESVPPHLFSHMLRGYFEGDGYITTNRSGHSPKVGIIGTHAFLTGVDSRLAKLGIASAGLKPKCKVFVLSIYGIDNVTRFANLIYQDADFVLDRKRRIFDEIEKGRHVARSQNSTSRFRGVSYDKRYRRFVSKATFQGITHTIGYFSSEEAAYEARVSFLKANNAYTSSTLSPLP